MRRNFAGSTAVDATLTNGAVGEDVVYGCIEKLNQLAVFPNDFGLMYRIAKVETDFGNTYGAAASVNRGIWQVRNEFKNGVQPMCIMYKFALNMPKNKKDRSFIINFKLIVTCLNNFATLLTKFGDFFTQPNDSWSTNAQVVVEER